MSISSFLSVSSLLSFPILSSILFLRSSEYFGSCISFNFLSSCLMRASKSTRLAIATFKDPFIVLSCLSNPSNSLRGNSLSLSLDSIKDVSCSASLTVASISLESPQSSQ